jgi:uncharacterized membrane protein YeaQ/YmgE (transglycosylase-associated protein family)
MLEGSILSWLAVGLVAGVLGKLLMPGKDPGGIIVTILIGIAGALLAGFVARAAGIILDGTLAQVAAATIGAFTLLLLYRLTLARRTR